MHIMFVCTGNICRSPMGELLLRRYLEGTSVEVSSAGIRGLPDHAIDPSSARLLADAGIDSAAFRARRLTRELAQSADLILCFETVQRQQVVGLAPAAVRYTFLLNEFSDMCEYCAEHGLVRGLTIQDRLASVIAISPMVRASMAKSEDIADPYGKSFEYFQQAAEETNRALRRMLVSMRKHYRSHTLTGRRNVVRR